MDTLLFVLGMHRSGTSAMTGALQLVGAHPGDDLMPPSPDENPLGYFEDRGIVAIHDAVLAAAGRSWSDIGAPDPDLLELLSASEVGDQIPTELFGAVAELLAYFYRLNEAQAQAG